MNQPARAGETGEASLALEGMRVVELAGGSAAAYCTHLLAGYGADVVRVEGADQLTSVDWQLSPDEQTYLLAGKRRVSVAGAEPATARAPLDAWWPRPMWSWWTGGRVASMWPPGGRRTRRWWR